jgi:hypothetical protein
MVQRNEEEFEYSGAYTSEDRVIFFKGLFALYLVFIFDYIFKVHLHSFFGRFHLIFCAVFLLLLLYALYRITTKLGFKGSLVLFIISIVYVLNNGGLSVFIR